MEGKRAAGLLNDLYAREWGWFRNFFSPAMKHLRTEVVGSRKKRIYDKPATPFERLKACPQVDPARLADLQRFLDSLNSFALKRTIECKLCILLRLQVRRPARRAA